MGTGEDTASPSSFSQLKRPQGRVSGRGSLKLCAPMLEARLGCLLLPSTWLCPQPASTLPGSLCAGLGTEETHTSAHPQPPPPSTYTCASLLPTFRGGRLLPASQGWTARSRRALAAPCSSVGPCPLSTPPGGRQLPGDPRAIGSPRHPEAPPPAANRPGCFSRPLETPRRNHPVSSGPRQADGSRQSGRAPLAVRVEG